MSADQKKLLEKFSCRVARKILFGLVGAAAGGVFGKLVADQVERVFDVSDKIADALDISADIVDGIVEAGITSAGGFGGTAAGDSLEEIIFPEEYPSNPTKGQVYKARAGECFVWTGECWLKLNLELS